MKIDAFRCYIRGQEQSDRGFFLAESINDLLLLDIRQAAMKKGNLVFL